MGNAGGKGASPVIVEALHAVVAKAIVGTKRQVPSVLELLTAQGADALVAERDKSLTASGKGQASDISEKDPKRISVAKNITGEAVTHRCAMDGACVRGVQGGQGTSGSRATETFEARASELPRSPEDEAAEKAATERASADKAEGLIKSLEANGIVADISGG